MASGYILGDGVLLNELSVNQRNNIYWTLVYIKKGVGMYMLDSSLLCLNEGDLIILPPGVQFCFSSKELGDEYNINLKAVVLRFDSAWLDSVLAAFPMFSDAVLKIKELRSPFTVWGPKWMKLSSLLDDALFSCDPSNQPVKVMEILLQLSSPDGYTLIKDMKDCDMQTLTARKEKIDRYGVWLALIAWVPIIGDIVAIALGFYKTRPGWTMVLLLVGKFARFLVWNLIYGLI